MICEDDISYQEILSFKVQRILSEVWQMEAQIQCVSTLESMFDALRDERSDIVFLDIMLGNENSVDFLAERPKRAARSQFILMTAYPVEAYNLSEVRICYYLIKSKLSDEQLTRALKKAISAGAQKDPHLDIIKIGNKNYTVNLQDILYVESFNNSVALHMIDGSSRMVYTTMKKFARTMPVNFLHCHKSYLVNMNHITAFEPHFFRMTDDITIPIPPKKYIETVNLYKNYLQNL